MKPLFKFTLGGDLGDQQISEPEGWATIIFNLERDLTYWSLIENFELPLIFYGIAQGNDGGYDYISSAILVGVDTTVTLDIEVSWDGGNAYENCFDGRIDLSTSKETIYRSKIQAAVVRNDIWAQFMANKSKPIDLFSTTDIYGNARLGIPQQELNLPSQKIRKEYTSYLQGNIGPVIISTDVWFESAGWTINNYIQFDCDTIVLKELTTAWEIPNDWNITTVAEAKFTMDFDGDYYFDLKIEGSASTFSVWAYGSTYVKWYIQKNSDAAILFNESNVGSGSFKSTVYTYVNTLSLVVGDEIHIYGKIISSMLGLGVNPFYQIWNYAAAASPSGAGTGIGTYPTYFNVTGNTTYQTTTTDSILIHDAGLSICDRILGKDDSFYSEFFGGANTVIHYSSNGCGYLNTLTRGLNIRGYSFTEKPFTLNFDDWWSGVNPIFNLGLGYEDLGMHSPGSTVIRIEDKASFFNSTPSVYLTGVNDIQVEFDQNLFTKTIEIGFETWSAESISGIDDPQTKHTYNLRYQLFGKDEKQLSKFIAASLAIEQTRRLTKVQSQDWRLDENVFIIALEGQSTDVDPQTSPPTVTEQPELFNSGVTGLMNSETRYNIRHTPVRMLSRWSDFYNGQMQDYLTDAFKYASGEGNFLMTWIGDGSCDNGTLTENQNISITNDYLFLPVVFTFTHPLTWIEYRTIRDNRKNAISISWILQGVTYTKKAFIRKLSYDINKSKGVFEVWVKNPPPISGDVWQWFSGDTVQWFSGDDVEL